MNEERFDEKLATTRTGPAGILGFRSNEDIEREEQERRAEKAMTDDAVQTELVSYVEKRYQQFKSARDSSGVTEDLKDALRRRQGKYSAAQLEKIRAQDLSEIYIGATEIQCNAGEAWLHDIDLSVSNKTWTLKASPEPDLPTRVRQEVAQRVLAAQQAEMEEGNPVTTEQVRALQSEIEQEVRDEFDKEAGKRAELLKERIEDKLSEVEWDDVKDEFRSHVLTFGTGILKGPQVWRAKKLKWANGTPTPTDILQYCGVYTVNPLDFYPCDNAIDTQDGDMIEVHRKMTRDDLEDLLSFESPYILHENIRMLLRENVRGVQDEQGNDHERKTLEKRSGEDSQASGEFFVKEFWGTIPGDTLAGAGVDGFEDGREYKVKVMWCKTLPLWVMPNPDPLGQNPYSKANYKRITGAFWGKGAPRLMDYAQDMANSSARSLVNNMGIASGPIVDIDITQIPPEQIKSAGKLWPWKVQFTESKPGVTRPAVSYWQAQLLSAELTGVLDKALQFAEDATGIPKYAYGNEKVAGAAATASGLNMLLNAASRGIKKSISNMDRAVASFLKRVVTVVMMYDEDASIKGDVEIVTDGTISVLLSELRQARIAEFLDRINNPVVLEYAGPEALIETLREYGELLKIDVENKLPTKVEVTQRIEQARMAQQEAIAAETQAKSDETQAKLAEKQAELELKRQELELKREELAIERARAVAEIERTAPRPQDEVEHSTAVVL